MPLVFGLDIGTTSVGFAVIDHDSELATGKSTVSACESFRKRAIRRACR